MTCIKNPQFTNRARWKISSSCALRASSSLLRLSTERYLPFSLMSRMRWAMCWKEYRQLHASEKCIYAPRFPCICAAGHHICAPRVRIITHIMVSTEKDEQRTGTGRHEEQSTVREDVVPEAA